MKEHKIKNRANTIKQKQEVIKRLLDLWITYPELRLGQLIENVCGNNGYDGYNDIHNLYFVEDYDLIETLEKFYKNIHKDI